MQRRKSFCTAASHGGSSQCEYDSAHTQLPALEEIEAMLAGRKQTAIVFFLDETFEELEYDATSTVLEAVEYLAGVIKLQSYQTFTLYECRKVISMQLRRTSEMSAP